MTAADDARLRDVATRVLEALTKSGSIRVELREELAEALGLPREAAHGRWTEHMRARARRAR